MVDAVSAVNAYSGDDDKKRTQVNGQSTKEQELVNTVFTAKVNDYYNTHKDEIERRLADDDPNNDSYDIDFEQNNLGIKGMSIQFSKKDGVEETQYSYQVVQSEDLVNFNGMQIRQGQNTHITEEMYKKYAELSVKICDPRKDVREAAEKEMKQLLDDIYRPLTKVENGKSYMLYTEEQLEQLKKGIITDIQAGDRFKNTTVYDDYSDYRKASKELRAQKKAAQERIDKAKASGEEPTQEDLDILRKECTLIKDSSVIELIKRNKDKFYDENGKFSSDKFKAYAKDLCGDDNRLTLSERHSNKNRLLTAKDKDGKIAQAQELLNKADRTYSKDEYDLALKQIAIGTQDGKYSEEDIANAQKVVDTYNAQEVVREAEKSHSWLHNQLFHDYGHAQRVIVQNAGLNADYDYRPLLTAGGIALSVAGNYIAAKLIKPAVATDTSAYTSAIADIQNTAADALANGLTDEVRENLQKIAAGAAADAISEAFATASVTNIRASLLTASGSGFVGGMLTGIGQTLTPESGEIVPPERPRENTLDGNGQVKKSECPPDPPNVDPDPKPAPEPEPQKCDCPAGTIAVTIPKAKVFTENGVKKGKGILLHQILDCYRGPNGEKIPRNRFKAFIAAYRKAELGGDNGGYLKAGQTHNLCLTFEFDGVTYTFDNAAYQKVQPVTYTISSGSTAKVVNKKCD